MAKLFLIRHGMTDVVGRVLAGWTPGVHLNTEGRQQVERLTKRLSGTRIDAIYSSPLERTRETAREIAAAQGLDVVVSEGVGEVRYGEWTGKTIEEVAGDARWRRWNEHRGEARSPGGESMLEIQSRVVSELLRIADAHPDQTVAVVSHGDPIRAAMAYFLATPLHLVLRIAIDPASVSVVRIEEWGIEVLGLNG
jgi:probable phosphoglycerate mutase